MEADETSDRPQPHDLAAERAYLSAIMNAGTPGQAILLLDLVPAGDLYRPQHAEIWRACETLAHADQPTGPVAVLHELERSGQKLDAPYLSEIYGMFTLASQGGYYAGIIRGHATHRRQIETSIRLAQAARIADPDTRQTALDRVIADYQAGQADNLQARGAESALDWERLFKTDYANVELITAPLLGWGEQVALVAAGKAGKSIFCEEWACCLATGRPFLGNLARSPLRVGYVDQENGHPELQRRFRTLGYDRPELLVNLAYLSFPPFRPLDTADGARDLLRLVDRDAWDVLFLDTVSRMISGPENDADTWLNLYRHTLLPLKARGTAVVRLDHLGKDHSRGARGSSAKTQDVDHVWELSEEPGRIYRLRRTHTRTGIGTDRVMLRRLGSPKEWGTTRHEVVPWGPEQESKWVTQNHLCKLMDEAGLPSTTGRELARKFLTQHGVKMRNDQLAELLAFRRQRFEDLAASQEPQPELPGLDTPREEELP